MQRVVNYGSFLQSYALKNILENLGHKAVFVDIRPGEQIISRPYKMVKNYKRHFLKRVSHVLFKHIRNKLFNEKFFPSIGIDTPVNEEDCDCVIIGSDEVFNCCQPSKWGFSTQLFGDTKVPSFTYAASCGYTTLERATELGVVKKICTSLEKLQCISVRDLNTSEFIERITGITPVMHLDPVLVYNWKSEISFHNKFKDYILIYAYDNRINDENEIRAIKEFAKKHNKKLISFGVYQRWCDKNVLCSPLELIGYFQDADYVITDTFHGTVLSIKFNKSFVTIIRESNGNKLNDLLTKFNLQDRQLFKIDELSIQMMGFIDYDFVNEKIKAESERTNKYLIDNLNKINKIGY